jgi:hypothetical protein
MGIKWSVSGTLTTLKTGLRRYNQVEQQNSLIKVAVLRAGKHQGLEAYPSIEDIAQSPTEGDALNILNCAMLFW